MRDRAMPLKEAKRIVKRVTEDMPITFFPRADGPGFYPYCILPIESRTEAAGALSTGLAHMYETLFEEHGIRVTTAVHPEAKAYLLSSDFGRFTGLRGVVTRKRDYGTPDQVVITIKTPYRGETKMYCIGLEESDTSLLIVDDIISGGLTEAGHVDAFEKHGCKVLGGIAAYERGNGLSYLRGTYPDKKFAGFARLEIVPRQGKARELRDMLKCDEEDIPEAFLEHLKNGVGNDELYSIINEHLRPGVPGFFDEDL